MTVTMQIEQFMDSKEEIMPLLELHYDELTLHKHIAKLDVNWDYYQRLQNKGKLFYLAVRDEGRLIGYSLFSVGYSPHYKELKAATNDVLFLHKLYRRGGVGIKMIKRSETELKAIGVQKILWHAKQNNSLSDLLSALGYGVEDILMSKVM
jgi:GNAT superfamily N-acetyltransferase